ncbi:MAG: 4Fe-4S dicluster domain-containing protein [Candidatus Omnitrophica bacterium]|nr:4Fe-4S dicluster domain-containing protein [Candidatus Omnitrophota bacterium]
MAQKRLTLQETVDQELGRRSFLKLAGIGVVASAIAALPAEIVEAAENFTTKKKFRYGMTIDLKRCVNCEACTAACKLENKTPPGVTYNPVIEEEVGEFPDVQRRWFPRPCFHCEKPPCIDVCPVGATYKREEDGIVLVDHDKCIGAGDCIPACPYGARIFDEGKNYPAQETEYGNIPSPEFHSKYGLREKAKAPIGNARKCTFCLHLQDASGQYTRPTACAETCMGKAIHFGDFLTGRCIGHGCNLNELITHRKWTRLKEELGTEPNVYYLL